MVARRLCAGDIQEIVIVYEYIRGPTLYNLPEWTALQKFRQLNRTFQLVTGKVIYSVAREELMWDKGESQSVSISPISESYKLSHSQRSKKF
jgi:hypothetical protein